MRKSAVIAAVAFALCGCGGTSPLRVGDFLTVKAKIVRVFDFSEIAKEIPKDSTQHASNPVPGREWRLEVVQIEGEPPAQKQLVAISFYEYNWLKKAPKGAPVLLFAMPFKDKMGRPTGQFSYAYIPPSRIPH